MKRFFLAFLPGLLFAGVGLYAQPVSNIAATRHNLSATGPGDVRATSNTRVCVFCHTPHGATAQPGAPLWNRLHPDQVGTTYTTYTSSSLDAETIAGQLAQPAGSSKLCLSCHDGTLAVDTVNVMGGQQNVNISMTGLGAGGVMPPGSGEQTGFTRNLGTDLTNDHPVSMTYDASLAVLDGELVNPVTSPDIDVGVPGLRPLIPLEATGPGGDPQVQCGSCHDPHLANTLPGENIKFLRLNRFQQAQPGSGSFNAATDIVCLGCHDKSGWSDSAHAGVTVADEQYQSSAASLREFPQNTRVWEAACLNCHDAHTVHGARRLLREGTDSLASPKSGGEAAGEETCYQCHSPIPIISNVGSEVPDILSEFQLPIRMPITTLDQQSITEVHDVTDADLSESQVNLGKTNQSNRHAECSDCHNPHRVMRNELFNGLGGSLSGTHPHTSATLHNNLASGVLRGTWGVEPNYGNEDFLSLPLSYDIKSGDGGLGAPTGVSNGHLTREYQVCLKCHSDFGYDDNGNYPFGMRPDLNDSGGGTLSGTNNMEQYTNQAMEFQAPIADTGEPGGNHRSWHPVIGETGRSAASRNMSADALLAPWDNAVGVQTMYCADCHGGDTVADSVIPGGNRPWGPHGSENDFLLKGNWNAATGNNSDRTGSATDPNNGLCFKCHDWQTYVDRDGNNNNSGFGGSKDSNLHAFHADRIERMRCSWCHTAVPHGWKNKGLLVNLNDVGGEAGLPSGTEISIGGSNQTYNQGPYYNNAKLKILTFATSGTWEDTNCGSSNGQGGTGRDWMRNVCENPP